MLYLGAMAPLNEIHRVLSQPGKLSASDLQTVNDQLAK